MPALDSPVHSPHSSAHRRWVVAVLVMTAGAWPFLFDGFQPAFLSLGPLGPEWLAVFVLIVAAVAWVPPIAGPMDRMLIRLAAAIESRPIVHSFFAAIGCTAYLALTAWGQRRKCFPIMQDEFSYLIQAHQFASGHLWMPGHPLADFFDSFQLLVKPVYASAYFPGTALLYVPGIWLHLPAYWTSLAIAGAVAGLFFWIMVGAVGGLQGWLAMLLLLSNSLYRQLSIMTLAQLPLLLYALSAVVAWMRWRISGGRKSAVMIGMFLGLAAVTRPVDALCFAMPIGVAMLLQRQRQQIVVVIAGVAPFVCLQLILNHGITGRWTETPFRLYADRDYPGMAYGFHRFDAAAKPESNLEQKRLLYQSYLPIIRDHRLGAVLKDLFPGRLRLTLAQQSPTPYPLLVLVCPVALLRLTRLRTVLLASFPLFVVLYAAYVFFLPHYVMVAAPAIILSMLLGARVLETSSGQFRRLAAVGLTLFIAGEAIAALPQWTVGHSDDAFDAPILTAVNEQIRKLGSRRAVILFSFDPKRNLNEEPVYNADVAWPDDAADIRAHDLGERNQELIQYYKAAQPDREFYRFNEATLQVEPLGKAKDSTTKK
jgi:hypothetical protein